jgi:hypothetical protein
LTARRLAILALIMTPALCPAQPLVRTIAPFVLERTSGEAFRNPFSGGLWQPRVGLRDVDGDGRLDLFTLNPDGELRYYRNEGALAFRRIVPSPYDALPVSNWFRFADLDGDGAAEILTAGPRSEVMVLDNDGTDAAPIFRVPARPLLDALGDTIHTQRETVPSLVDIDRDGDLDLFAGDPSGSITFYRNTGTQTSAVFTFETASYMDILVIAPGSARGEDDGGLHSSRLHGASVLDFADLDGDGDLDMLFGDFFTRKLLHFENTGTPQSASFSMARLDTAFRPTGDDVESEGFNQPVTGDLDVDGDLDVIIASLYPTSDAQPLILYENTGTPTAPVLRRRPLDLTSELDIGIFAAPTAIEDIARNGILVGSAAGRLTYLERVKIGVSTRFRIAATIPVPGLFQTIPAAGDLDGDGTAEVVIGESNGSIVLTRFAGNTLVRYGDTFQLNRNASPTLVDLDGDGDLDIVSGAENGRFYYFQNTGSPTSARFVRATPPSPFDALDVGQDSSPRFFDLDGDGVLEAIVGSRTGGATGIRDTMRFFERTGTTWTPSSRFAPMAVGRNPVPLGMRLAEGRFLFVGDLAGGIKAFVDSAHASVVENESRVDGLTIGIDAGAIVVSSHDAGTAGSLRVVDALGRLVLERLIVPGERRMRVDFGELPCGTYLVEAAVGSRRVAMVVPVVR